MVTLEDTAWAAGLFEGEGCIVVNKTNRKTPQWRLRIDMTDLDVLEKFHRIVGAGTIRARKIGKNKPQWLWHVGSKSDVSEILNKFKPFLGNRRLQRAEECLSAIDKL